MRGMFDVIFCIILSTERFLKNINNMNLDIKRSRVTQKKKPFFGNV
jgi:hypothetical protein